MVWDDKLTLKRPWPSDFCVPAGETQTWRVEIVPVPARSGEFSGRPIVHYALNMRSRLNGQMWRTTSDRDVEPVQD